MNEGKSKPRPWLIAAWPGMGNVAMIAAGHLIDQLKMVETCDLLPGEHFDVTEVEVRSGLAAGEQIVVSSLDPFEGAPLARLVD